MKKWLVAALALVLMSAACGAAGSETAKTFEFDYPDVDPAPVVLDIQTGTLNVRPVDGKSVKGTVTTNVRAWQVSQTTDSDGTQHVTQGEARDAVIPNASNRWDVDMGTGQPLALTINSLAASSDLKLGKLPLRDLEISGTSGDQVLEYDSPNPLDDGGTLQIHLTSGNVTVNGVFNSHVGTLQSVTTGGNQSFDFGNGDLVQDMQMDIEARIGDISLRIPIGTPTRVMFTGASGRVMAHSPEFVEVSSGIFETAEYTAGDTPHVEITVQTVAGDLRMFAVPRT